MLLQASLVLYLILYPLKQDFAVVCGYVVVLDRD